MLDLKVKIEDDDVFHSLQGEENHKKVGKNNHLVRFQINLKLGAENFKEGSETLLAIISMLKDVFGADIIPEIKIADFKVNNIDVVVLVNPFDFNQVNEVDLIRDFKVVCFVEIVGNFPILKVR